MEKINYKFNGGLSKHFVRFKEVRIYFPRIKTTIVACKLKNVVEIIDFVNKTKLKLKRK